MQRRIHSHWIILFLIILLLMTFLSSLALADISPLPLDQKKGGTKPQPSGWYGDGSDADKYINYKDPSIDVTTRYLWHNGVHCTIVKIRIADPTQIRTAMSYDSYDRSGQVSAKKMATSKNAIAAVNGDFFKYHYDIGYVVRQGVFYRDKLNGKRDVLIIDNHGDFWSLHKPSSQKMKDFLNNEFPSDRQVINTFSLGPVLIKNGKVQEITSKEFAAYNKRQRVGIIQISDLNYAIVACDGDTNGSSGMSMEDFAKFIKKQFPTAKLAYNLDGGGSSNIIVHSMRVNHNMDARTISDILYFASAYKK